jgi:hypothetical protein
VPPSPVDTVELLERVALGQLGRLLPADERLRDLLRLLERHSAPLLLVGKVVCRLAELNEPAVLAVVELAALKEVVERAHHLPPPVATVDDGLPGEPLNLRLADARLEAAEVVSEGGGVRLVR